MEKAPLFLFACLAGAAYSTYRGKEHPRMTFRVHNAPGLTVQLYSVGLLGNMTASYLTDSATFCRYLGTLDEESEIVAVRVYDDQVVMEKSDNGRHSSEPQPVHQTVYRLCQLQQEHAFD